MKYSFSRWWFRCWSSESVVTWRGCTWLWGMFYVSRGGGCMWSWGRFWGGQQEYGKPIFYPSISVNLKMLWKECSLKRKKWKPRKKNPVIPFMLMNWVILCWMALPVNLCQVNWTCFESHWAYTTGKPQATWSDPQCSVSTFVLTSLAMIPGACSCTGNGFHFPRYFFMSAGATESRWILLVISKLLEDPAVI